MTLWSATAAQRLPLVTLPSTCDTPYAPVNGPGLRVHLISHYHSVTALTTGSIVFAVAAPRAKRRQKGSLMRPLSTKVACTAASATSFEEPKPKTASGAHGMVKGSMAWLHRHGNPADVNEPVENGTNCAFMFLKPHANTPDARELSCSQLAEAGIKIVKHGSITAEELDERRIIDSHYGTLAARALDQSPLDAVVKSKAQAAFKTAFGLSWQDALARGLACNAREAMQRLQCSADALDEKWTPLELGKDKVKFGGGFYCGHIDGLYVINGFYLAMRGMYTKPGRSVHWFSVEWSSDVLSWAKFRETVLGNTDPAHAFSGSLRGSMYRQWRELQFPNQPHVGENAVHASASPFEGMLERMNWLGIDIREDPFGRALLKRDVQQTDLRQWATDPVVFYRGCRHSLFDLFENLDSKECLDIAQELA